MSAKYQIKIPATGVTATTINIPINLEPYIVDQSELINTKFIDVEVEKSINPIFDYEKVRLIPTLTGITNNTLTLTKVKNVTYNAKFVSSASFPIGQTVYSDIGMVNDDIKFGKKRFESSFLNLSFYDTDRATDQRLLALMDIYPRLSAADIQGPLDPTPGLPKAANQIPVSFTLTDPIKNPAGFAEGYHLYHFKDEISIDLPKELYMRARFNNAATGKQTNMITEGQAFTIDNLVNKLYTRYVLYRNATGYYYVVDDTYSNNIVTTAQDITINLYEIQAL